jgi:large subunit ribosomal protein L24
MVARVRKNDKVVILAGKDKGKEGTVIDLATKNGKVVVKGAALELSRKRVL